MIFYINFVLTIICFTMNVSDGASSERNLESNDKTDVRLKKEVQDDDLPMLRKKEGKSLKTEEKDINESLKCTADRGKCTDNAQCCNKFCTNGFIRRSCTKTPQPFKDWVDDNFKSKFRAEDNSTKSDNDTQIPPCLVNDIEQYNSMQRAGIPEEKYRWRGGFYFKVDPEFSRDEFKTIANGLNQLYMAIKCLDFFVWPNESKPTTQHVIILKGAKGSGCKSDIGKQTKINPQYINLETSLNPNDSCLHPDVVIHETMHALGLSHEQSRPDRDKYVNIFSKNIVANQLSNFDLNKNYTTFGSKYSLDSIMHYSSWMFSKLPPYNLKHATILKKDGTKIGRNTKLVPTDAQKLQAMYCNNQ